MNTVETPLAFEEEVALSIYTAPGYGYRCITTYLREKDRKRNITSLYEHIVDIITKAILKEPLFIKNVKEGNFIVYRGIKSGELFRESLFPEFREMYQPGNTVLQLSPTSTSLDKYSALGFTNNIFVNNEYIERCCLLHITLPRGVKAISTMIPKYHRFNAGAREIILPAGGSFHVDRVEALSLFELFPKIKAKPFKYSFYKDVDRILVYYVTYINPTPESIQETHYLYDETLASSMIETNPDYEYLNRFSISDKLALVYTLYYFYRRSPPFFSFIKYGDFQTEDFFNLLTYKSLTIVRELVNRFGISPKTDTIAITYQGKKYDKKFNKTGIFYLLFLQGENVSIETNEKTRIVHIEFIDKPKALFLPAEYYLDRFVPHFTYYPILILQQGILTIEKVLKNSKGKLREIWCNYRGIEKNKMGETYRRF